MNCGPKWKYSPNPEVPSMFRGSSSHKLDPKGRLSVPSRFRSVLTDEKSEGVMVSTMDGCLVAYTYPRWGELEQRIMGQSRMNEGMRRFRRIFVGNAHDCTLDRQGRILIPPSLRRDARLEQEIVLVGVLDHFEIWSEAEWAKQNEMLHTDLEQDDIRDQIAELGL